MIKFFKQNVDDYLNSLNREDKIKILSYAVKKLYNTISAEDILRENEYGQWIIEGKPIMDTEKNLLIAEATQLQKTKLWEVLQKDIKYQANRKMFLLARTEDDLIMGKMWLYVLDCFNTRLKSLKNSTGSFNKQAKS